MYGHRYNTLCRDQWMIQWMNQNAGNPNMSFPQMFQMFYTQQHMTNQLNQKSQEKQTDIMLELLRKQVDVDRKIDKIDCKVDGQGAALSKLEEKLDEENKKQLVQLNGLNEKVDGVLKVVQDEKKSKIDPKPSQPTSTCILSYEFCKPDETCTFKRKRIIFSSQQVAEMSKCLKEFNEGKQLKDFVKFHDDGAKICKNRLEIINKNKKTGEELPTQTQIVNWSTRIVKQLNEGHYVEGFTKNKEKSSSKKMTNKTKKSKKDKSKQKRKIYDNTMRLNETDDSELDENFTQKMNNKRKRARINKRISEQKIFEYDAE